jgi:hypothetical protein
MPGPSSGILGAVLRLPRHRPLPPPAQADGRPALGRQPPPLRLETDASRGSINCRRSTDRSSTECRGEVRRGGAKDTPFLQTKLEIQRQPL